MNNKESPNTNKSVILKETKSEFAACKVGDVYKVTILRFGQEGDLAAKITDKDGTKDRLA